MKKVKKVVEKKEVKIKLRKTKAPSAGTTKKLDVSHNIVL